ncbi:MAG TPA: ATP-binding protein [Coleofasciculaceae cyanobacterium]
MMPKNTKGLEEKFARLIQQTPLALIEWNREFKAVSWNPAAEKIFGYSAEDMYLQHASTLVPEHVRPHVDGVMTALLQQMGGTFSRNDNLKKDGSIITCEWINTPVLDDGGEPLGIYSIVQDITDRVEAEQTAQQSEAQLLQKSAALEQAIQDLQRAQLHLIHNEKMLALGNLVAGIAHEINNPLGFLKGNINPALEHLDDLFALIDLYQDKYPDPDLEIQDLIDDIDLDFIRIDLPKLLTSMNQGIDRIRDISNGLRTFSRSDSDHPVIFDLHDGLDSTILLLKHRLKGHDHRPAIEVVKQYGKIPEIECFAGQLNQVFMNLLANAIDELDEACQDLSLEFLHQNPQQITITTQLSCQHPDLALQDLQDLGNNLTKWIEIRIQDNGRGISDDVKSQIFEHLFTTKSVGKGTGLGLTLSRQIIEEKHGGRLTLESAPGQGTTFRILLPLVYENL